MGVSDEAYAFDETGLMLSESRHRDKLREARVLKNGGLAHTALNVELRDPGGDLLSGHTAPDDLGAQPHTRLAAQAIAARSRRDWGIRQGVLAEPYRNYLGSEVIGAWRWLERHDFVVAVEVASDEAYVALRSLDRPFAVVVRLSIAASVGILISLVGAFRDRMRYGRTRKIGRYTLGKKISARGHGAGMARAPCVAEASDRDQDTQTPGHQ